jgi:hypothetical protein
MSNGQDDQKLIRRSWMGVINNVANKQEEYKAILHEMFIEGDPTFEELTVQTSQYSEEVIANIASSLHENIRGQQPLDKNEIYWAISLLDVLDTLGMTVRFKSNGKAD